MPPPTSACASSVGSHRASGPLPDTPSTSKGRTLPLSGVPSSRQRPSPALVLAQHDTSCRVRAASNRRPRSAPWCALRRAIVSCVPIASRGTTYVPLPPPLPLSLSRRCRPPADRARPAPRSTPVPAAPSCLRMTSPHFDVVPTHGTRLKLASIRKILSNLSQCPSNTPL